MRRAANRVSGGATKERRRTDASWGDLLARVAHGDGDALHELYAESSAVVYGLARAILREESAAEEATLDVYHQVWREASRYRPDRGSPLAWLVALTRSRAIDRLRSRRKDALPEAVVDLDLLPAAELDPAAASCIAEWRGRVRSAVARLTPPQRAAIGMAFLQGCSHSEAARRLGEPLGTVKTRIRDGIRELREQLAPLHRREQS